MLDYSSQRFRGIFILIPTFNEENGIGTLIDSLLGLGVPSENIFVFDDASSDNTVEIVKSRGIPVERNIRNRGKGASLRNGFSILIKKSAKWIITMDGDGQHSVDDIPNFLINIQNNNGVGIIIGSRKKSLKNMPPARIFSNVATSKFLSLLLGSEISDSQCGYRAYNCQMLGSVELTYDHFELETEVIIKSIHSGYPVRNLSIKTIYNKDVKSNISHILDTYRWLKALIFTLFRVRFKRES